MRHPVPPAFIPPGTRDAGPRHVERAAFAAVAAALLGSGMLLFAGGPAASPDPAPDPAPRVAAASAEAAGRYLMVLGGCNDCHTDGYVVSNGAQPAESAWLTGSAVGFRGPWGVSYPPNLRLSVAAMDEAGWVTAMRQRDGLPPMPWPSLAGMDEADLRAIYRYIRALGPAGETAPAALPPGVLPDTPVIDFVPVMPQTAAR